MALPNQVNVLLLGSGGRECAFAWKISQSPRLGKLFIAPGNGGTADYGINVDLSPVDFPVIGQFVQYNNINLIVVGPEDPLVKGIKDYFVATSELRHISIVGPSKAAAALEGSKDVAKRFMERHNIPTAKYLTVNEKNIEEGLTFLESLKAPYVLKADGLAAGKGVLILDTVEEAKSQLKEMIVDAKFGEASKNVVIEEFLSGIELSVFVATDGESYKLLPSAKDYKRIGENDMGLNTGGMGAVSPVPFADKTFMDKVIKRIVEPTIQGIKNDNLDYKGFVFIGLMACDGEPFVIEYNVRMGDPETESVMSLIDSDIIDLFEGIVHKNLGQIDVRISDKTATTIVLTAKNYPNDYPKGDEITLPKDSKCEATIFHSGTVVKGTKLLTNGGRVLAITALGDNIEDALNKAYKAADAVEYAGKYFRKDIGQDLINLTKTK